EGKVQRVKNSQDQTELGRGFTSLELIDPLSRHPSSRREVCLVQPQVDATTAYGRCEVSYRAY
ncbi:MAG TPA: hypothetical protein VK252_03435, partial [Solirubrobacteraceae bacterium]|nr:hypothetical protein [Solirubrobacteraceae bacterium]